METTEDQGRGAGNQKERLMPIEVIPGRGEPDSQKYAFPWGNLPGTYECVACERQFSLVATGGIVWGQGGVLVMCYACRTPQIVAIPSLPHATPVLEEDEALEQFKCWECGHTSSCLGKVREADESLNKKKRRSRRTYLLRCASCGADNSVTIGQVAEKRSG